MGDAHELTTPRGTMSRHPGRRAVPWTRLLSAADPGEALEVLAQWFGSLAERLELLDPHGKSLASWRSGVASDGARYPFQLPVAGDPPWSFAGRLSAPPPSSLWIEHAALALEAWRQAGGFPSAGEEELARRAAVFDRLQALGRAAADATSPGELFTAAAAFLGRELPVDLLVAAWDGEPLVTLFLSRPFEPEVLNAVAERAERLLGAVHRERRVVRGEDWDAGRGGRGDFDEGDLLLLPLLRRGSLCGCFGTVLARPGDERGLRLLHATANQLGLQLERILAAGEAEADRFRSVVESLPLGVLVVDATGRCILTNACARTLFAGIGASLDSDGVGALEQAGLVPLLERCCAGSPAPECEIRPSEGTLWSVTVTPLGGRARDRRDRLLVIHDVSEARRLQERIAQSEKMSSLGQMISGVAHELNNPLASILGYAQLLGRRTADESTARQLEVLAREAERCRRIVQSLLSFARHRAPERRTLSLNEVVRSVLQLLAYQLRVDDVRVSAELDEDLPPIEGDAHQLEQVLVNLVANARQAIGGRAGGGEVRLCTRADATEGVVLDVSDDGPGVPASLRSRIFDPFFTTKRPGEGTGLGLSIVYGIVAEHGGTIRLLDGPGAAFRLSFPARGSARVADAPAGVETASDVRAVGNSRILVVDDEDAVAALICEALAADGHLPERAVDGLEALERLSGSVFDLVISDLKMPGMDGRRLYDELRRRDPQAGPRLLFTTGDTVSGEAEAFVAGSGCVLLRKPFDLEDLRRKVRDRLASA